MDAQTHPSFLMLDRLAVGADVPAALAQHVTECERCRAHVERMRQPAPLPRWASERCARPAQGVASWAGSGWTRWLWAGGGCAALLLVALIVTRAGVVQQDEPYIGSRGAAAVGLYVKRGERVFLWDGQQPVRAGDRLRLKVVPDGFTQVAVFTLAANDAPLESLYEAPLASVAEVLLPPAWAVDDEAGPEMLIVVLAHGLSAEELQAHAHSRPKPTRSDVWVRRFTLEKAAPGELPKPSNEAP